MEGSTWFGLHQGFVLDVTTMNLSDDLVQSKCEVMLNGQKPTLLIGGSHCAESGELNERLKSLQSVIQLYERQRCEEPHFMHAHPEGSKS